ncbi:Lrp/AsnC family transcriptional regulator, partial [Pseudomonas bubulae]|uniref:Lrp/AsnC family transcriptional regulator n=1 Tax=Pseudomonas bubulae TaxID=2316085 RepID=UPI003D02B813
MTKGNFVSKLDRYDLSILAELQRDARISNQELAERIGLSPSPCSRRVKQLEDDGYISRQVALLDRKLLGLSLTAYVLIGMDRHTPERFENFEACIRALPQVLVPFWSFKKGLAVRAKPIFQLDANAGYVRSGP